MVDGVVCPSDPLAISVIQAATDLGIRVPDDLLLIGDDDDHFASESSIPVSTVGQPGRRMGELAVELLLAEIREPSERLHQTETLDPHLIPRRSTLHSPEDAWKPKELMSLTWPALPIAANEDFDGAPLLRTEFELEEGHGPVARATLHVTAHGIFEAYLNGQPVSDDVLSPGWSSYEWRLRYRSYDVTSLLQARSVLGIALGNGWFRGRLGWSGGRALYGDELAAVAQLEIEFSDGYLQMIMTDESWTAGPSAVVSNDLYDGETIDARRQSDAWLRPGFTNMEWTGVHPGKIDFATLTPYIGPPVRRQEELRPINIWTSPSGKTLVDFGQNLVGWLRLNVRGPAGTTITVRHAEVLEHDELVRGPCAVPRPPTTSFSAAATMCSSRHSPSMGSAMSRWTDGLAALTRFKKLRTH